MPAVALASPADPAPPPAEVASPLEPPGGVLVWLVIAVELVTFGGGLVAFAAARRDEPAAFALGRASLDQRLALANTLVLLVGGWAMARAVATLREGRADAARRFLAGATASSVAFLALKGVEWGAKLARGLGLRHDTFFTGYWLLTGFHVLHVVAALAILVALLRGVAAGRITAHDPLDVEAGGAFFHLCDLVWLLLYPSVYLLGGAS